MLPCPNASPEAGHPDAAGWVLGALDAADATMFEAHLGSCEVCQAAVADFEQVARNMARAAPELRPPPELHDRTLAAVAEAARATARKPVRKPVRKPAVFRRHWNLRLLSLASAAGAAVIAAAVFVALQLGSGPSQVFAIPLRGATGSTASGEALAHHTDGGWSIRLSVRGLPDLGANRFYECWYAGSGSRPGKPGLITAGTFTVGRSGSTTVDMTSAADPRTFTTMQITAEQAGDASQHGKIVLSGTARS
jgi:anti-sigma-K factor RskA